MNTPIIHPAQRHGSTLSPLMALRLAWLTYATVLVVPFFVALGFIWHLNNSPGGILDPHANQWFLASMIVVATAVAGASLWREHVFKDYREGRTVPPRKYLVGMMGVWGSLAFAGLFSLAGCIVTQTLLPNLIPAFMGLTVYLLLWPTGHAMIRPVGGSEDPQTYEEPR